MDRKRMTKGLKAAGLALVAIVAIGWAGSSDYQDAVITEMLDNGTYYKLSRQHPKASDGELVEIYEGLKKEKAEQVDTIASYPDEECPL